jgi:hypothetical protein
MQLNITAKKSQLIGVEKNRGFYGYSILYNVCTSHYRPDI